MSKLVNSSKFKIYSAINIPERIINRLYLLPSINETNKIEFEMNSGVMLKPKEFASKVKNCDIIICSSFSHQVNKELIDSAGGKLKVT